MEIEDKPKLFSFSFLFFLCLSDIFNLYVYIYFIYDRSQEAIMHCLSAWYGDNQIAKQRKS